MIKKRKYSNVKCEYDGIKFDSLREMRRYKHNLLRLQAGEITEIELQPRFDIIINGKFCGFYKGDFKLTLPNGDIVIEDSKGMKTVVYNLKKKIIQAMYSITIVEV
jgi:hypothetical protein